MQSIIKKSTLIQAAGTLAIGFFAAVAADAETTTLTGTISDTVFATTKDTDGGVGIVLDNATFALSESSTTKNQNLYGGGSDGTTVNGNTSVTLNNTSTDKTRTGTIYGGSDSNSVINGNTSVVMNGGKITQQTLNRGAFFGGSHANSTISGNTSVHIGGNATVSTVFGGSDNSIYFEHLSSSEYTKPDKNIGSVSAYFDDAEGCAKIGGNTSVYVEAGSTVGVVFAGSRGTSVIGGNTVTEIYGTVSTVNIGTDKLGKIYGSVQASFGNGAVVKGNVMSSGTIYGNNVVFAEDGSVSSVIDAGKVVHQLNFNGATADGAIYTAGMNGQSLTTQIYGSTETNFVNSQSKRSIQGGLSAHIYGNVTVNVKDSTVGKHLYGGQERYSTIEGNVYLNIENSTIEKDVYGGNYGLAGAESVTKGKTFISIVDSVVNGNVYGGGKAGGSTSVGDVFISISGDKTQLVNVYVGGVNQEDQGRGNVSGNASISVSGGKITGVIDGSGIGGTSTLNIVNTDATAEATIQNFGKVVISGTKNFTVGKIADCTETVVFGGTLVDGVFTASNTAADGSTETEVAAGTSVTVTSASSVTLASSTEAFTVNTARELEVSEVSLPAEGDVEMSMLAAWAFDITKDAGTEVQVTLDVGAGLSLDAIQIFHKGDASDAAWENVTEKVENRSYDSSTGKLTFTTKDFSSYAAGTVVPEPSAFGLLAGAAALAFVAARRRRNKR